MQNILTGDDVMTALEAIVPTPDADSNSLVSAISTAQSTISVELHALARNTSRTIRDVPVSARDIENMIDEVKLTLEMHGMHELPGRTGEGIRKGRDLMIGKLRALLVGTETA